MASSSAGARIRHKRVEHIHELVAQVGDRERTAAHLISLTFRAVYYFFMGACLVAGVVAYGTGRHDKAALWGSIGVTLAALWFGVKILSRVVDWAVRAIKDELKERKAEAEQDDQTPVEAAPIVEVPAASPDPVPDLPGGRPG